MRILKFNEYCELYNEGLIKTYDFDKCENYIKNKLNTLNLDYTINFFDDSEDKFDVSVDTNGAIIITEIKDIANYISNLCGYFPSSFISTNKLGGRQFKWNDLNNNTVNSNTINLKIRFESKYSVTEEIICPDELFHFTPKTNLPNIMKYGLYPKAKNRDSEHPSRIYLFPDYENNKGLLNGLKRSDLMNNTRKEYVVLRIDCSTKKLKLYTDPNYTKGYFTYDNINPKYITVQPL
jgi:hypothetical protein